MEPEAVVYDILLFVIPVFTLVVTAVICVDCLWRRKRPAEKERILPTTNLNNGAALPALPPPSSPAGRWSYHGGLHSVDFYIPDSSDVTSPDDGSGSSSVSTPVHSRSPRQSRPVSPVGPDIQVPYMNHPLSSPTDGTVSPYIHVPYSPPQSGPPGITISVAPSPPTPPLIQNISKTKNRLKKPNKSASVPDLASMVRSSLRFTILYDKSNHILIFDSICIKNIPIYQTNKHHAYLCIEIMPLGEKETSPLKLMSLDLEFCGRLEFADLSPEELSRSTALVMVLATSEPYRVSELIAECPVALSEILSADGSAVCVSRYLNTTRRKKKKSTTGNCLRRPLGELSVVLQYQSRSSRMKVFLRKAKCLAKTDTLPGKPDHQLVLNILRRGTAVTQRETKLQAGYNPTWNEPYLFDIPSHDVKNYAVDVIVRSTRVYGQTILGHVPIGPDSTQHGVRHWQEVLENNGVEVAKWHPILPQFKY